MNIQQIFDNLIIINEYLHTCDNLNIEQIKNLQQLIHELNKNIKNIEEKYTHRIQNNCEHEWIKDNTYMDSYTWFVCKKCNKERLRI